jgi:hypothetical protein
MNTGQLPYCILRLLTPSEGFKAYEGYPEPTEEGTLQCWRFHVFSITSFVS